MKTNIYIIAFACVATAFTGCSPDYNYDGEYDVAGYFSGSAHAATSSVSHPMCKNTTMPLRRAFLLGKIATLLLSPHALAAT